MPCQGAEDFSREIGIDSITNLLTTQKKKKQESSHNNGLKDVGNQNPVDLLIWPRVQRHRCFIN